MPSRTHPFQSIRANQTKGCVHDRGQVKPPESGAISFDEKPQAITPESLHGRLQRQQIVKERCSWLIGQLLRNLGIIEQGYNHPGKLRANRRKQAKASKSENEGERQPHTKQKTLNLNTPYCVGGKWNKHMFYKQLSPINCAPPIVVVVVVVVVTVVCYGNVVSTW
jgi:hypothetical protein